MKGFSGTWSLLALAALALGSSPAAATLPGPGNLSDPTPYAPSAVHALYATEIRDGLDGFLIAVDLDVLEFDLQPLGGQAAAEIRAAPEAVRALFESAVEDTIRREAARVLPEARITLDALRFDYGVEDGDLDPYRPGIHIQALLNAAFTPAFFGLPPHVQTSGADVARAFLYSGGSYALGKDLEVPPGFNVRHVVDVPSFLELREPGDAGTDRLEFRKDNFGSSQPTAVHVEFEVRLREGQVPANVMEGPLVAARFIVDDTTPAWKQAIPLLGGDYVGTLDLDIQVHSLAAALFASYPLPRELELEQVSGDLLRIAIREDLVSRADVRDFFDGLVRRSLAEGFGDDVELAFDWPAFDRSLSLPVGGADGASVEPVRVQARAVLPFESNKMLVSSSLGRLFSMTVGMSGSFDLANHGMWNADYTIAYPEGVHVHVTDSAGLVEDLDWSEREGFHVYLPKGAETRIHVTGRTDFQPGVFTVGVLELAFAGYLVWFLARKVRGLWRGRSKPRVV